MNDACFLRSELLASHGVTAIFSLRHGGVSHPSFDSLNLGSNLGEDEKNIADNMKRKSWLPYMPAGGEQLRRSSSMPSLQCNSMVRSRQKFSPRLDHVSVHVALKLMSRRKITSPNVAMILASLSIMQTTGDMRIWRVSTHNNYDVRASHKYISNRSRHAHVVTNRVSIPGAAMANRQDAIWPLSPHQRFHRLRA